MNGMNPYAAMGQLLGIVWIFFWAVFILVAWHLRWKRRMHRLELAHRERLAAMEKGLPVPELPDLEGEARAKFDARLRKWLAGDLRQLSLLCGLLLFTGGAGTLAALWLVTDAYQHAQWPFALIPIAVGCGLLLQYALTRPSPGK